MAVSTGLYRFEAFKPDDIFVTLGANLGEGLTTSDEVNLGDLYELDRTAQAQQVSFPAPSTPDCAPVRLLAQHVLMSGHGDKLDLLLIEHEGMRWLLPLTPIEAAQHYTLIKTIARPPVQILRNLMCLSFVRGTMITLASGQQKAIEHLNVDDLILTRDHGAQPLRYIGTTRIRASGPFAPVVFSAGHFENYGDLLVSQSHRMFVYHRKSHSGLARSEYLIQARHFVDDKAVYIRQGGLLDWYSLVFDRHEIIYAQGIPVESLLVNDATLPQLPTQMAAELIEKFPSLRQSPQMNAQAVRMQDLVANDHDIETLVKPRRVALRSI